MAITAGLHGAGGFGKTTLARFAAAQPKVRKRFSRRDLVHHDRS
ncbi:hypothetical protein [Streptomyces sp. RB110-2]|nr:hypothetical protein [Streptomyces sp. RB110-2]